MNRLPPREFAGISAAMQPSPSDGCGIGWRRHADDTDKARDAHFAAMGFAAEEGLR